MMNLKELRISKNLTQKEAAILIGVSLRSYKDYENNPNKFTNYKYESMVKIIEEYNKIDEEHGILEIDDIKTIVKKVFDKYEINLCYLFGSYAKNNPTSKSDIDLLIDSDIIGLKFYGLVEELRQELHKKVDLLRLKDLEDNELLKEILKDGIKIYTKWKYLALIEIFSFMNYLINVNKNPKTIQISAIK